MYAIDLYFVSATASKKVRLVTFITCLNIGACTGPIVTFYERSKTCYYYNENVRLFVATMQIFAK